jgi:hypothetical protein
MGGLGWGATRRTGLRLQTRAAASAKASRPPFDLATLNRLFSSKIYTEAFRAANLAGRLNTFCRCSASGRYGGVLYPLAPLVEATNKYAVYGLVSLAKPVA